VSPIPPEDQGPSRASLLNRAEAKERLAGRFDGWATQLESLLARVSTTAKGTEVWTGPAAERFSGAAKDRKAETDALAENCRTTAANLRRSAGKLREDAKRALH
jgi:uncharacterized protein YukE